MKNRLSHLFLLLPLFLATAPAAAGAQERGQTGVAMGYPAVFAFVWHASDTLAIRPEVSFAHSSSESESTVLGESTSSSGWNVGVGASVLWYVQKLDRVQTYFSPRIAFTHSSSESGFDEFNPRTTNSVGAWGSFGAQYTPVRKFSVYGEVGYGFSRGTFKFNSPIQTTKNTSWIWSPRSSAGVIFYFGRS